MAHDTVGAADEVFHVAGDDADWCESGWFAFNFASETLTTPTDPPRPRQWDALWESASHRPPMETMRCARHDQPGSSVGAGSAVTRGDAADVSGDDGAVVAVLVSP
jgi:hypothetical protein